MNSELPGYSEAPGPSPGVAGSSGNSAQASSPYTISLQDEKGFKWLILAVSSRASASTSLPVFYEGDVISGQVDLDVLKSESIKCISIKITAGTTLVGQEEQLFLNTETNLWIPSMSLPDGSQVAKLATKKYSWPFSLALPAEIEVQDQKTKKKFPLPTSFSERASTGYIDYKLIVTIKRGMLRVDQTLMTAFAYLPVTRPELPSPMLQKAYKEGLHLVGPEGDPDGWHTLPPLIIQGILFNSHPAEVTLNLALAKPETTNKPSTSSQSPRKPSSSSFVHWPQVPMPQTIPTIGQTIVSSKTSHAQYFGAVGTTGAKEQRVLHGEVDVKKSFRPSTLFPRFTISYRLDLQPFETAGFVVTAPKSTPLLRQKVTIANFPAFGIPVCSRAPPEYVQQQGADYNSSFGLLENGNQRFLHHEGTGAI
ncbi:hypothetical protein J3R82DRAFT_11980 [Butyriboletus roseoflavus]|nr:hypothetical protein J3R82DRAFT_11980 [Butyriboletus roseoflavus]